MKSFDRVVKNIPKFSYKAVNLQGKTIEGLYEAKTKEAVISMIRDKEFYPTRIMEMEETKSIGDLEVFMRIPEKQISLFCEQFATIIKAGVPVTQGLYMLSQQCEHRVLRKTLVKVFEKVQTGKTISEAMRQYQNRFPPLLVNMVEAGEISGTLQNALDQMAVHFQKQYQIKQKIHSALVYPMVVCGVAISVIYFILTQIVPKFTSLYTQNKAELPFTTHTLLQISNYFQKNGISSIALFLFFMILLKVMISKGRGRYLWHRICLGMPFIGHLITRIISVRLTRTMSTLSKVGIPLDHAVSITEKVMENAVAEQGLRQAEEDIQRGMAFSFSIERINLFPQMVVHMLKVGEASGYMENMLDKTAEFYENEVNRIVERLITLMEPAIILLLGGMVAFILLSIALPMFDSMSFIG